MTVPGEVLLGGVGGGRPGAVVSGAHGAIGKLRDRPRETIRPPHLVLVPIGRATRSPQELQIAMLPASRKTTRETAAAHFRSAKTVEYHLRHVHQKLGINSRDELSRALPETEPVARRRRASRS